MMNQNMDTLATKFFISIIFLTIIQPEQIFAEPELNNSVLEQDLSKANFQAKITDFSADSLKHLDTYFEFARYLDKIGETEKSVEKSGIALEIARNTANEKNGNDPKSMAMVIVEKRQKLIQKKHNKDFRFDMQNMKNINPEKTRVRVVIDIPIIE